MLIDFSLFKNIDFTNKDNLIFLAIFFGISVIVLATFIIIIVKVAGLFKRVIARMSAKKLKRTVDVQNATKPQIVVSREQTAALPKSMATIKIDTPIDNKKVSEQKEAVSIPMPKAGEAVNFRGGEKNLEMKKNVQEVFKDKENKSISEHLGKLNINQNVGKESLASKMPSRAEVKGADVGHEPIKIATRKDFSAGEERQDGLVGGTGRKDVFGNIPDKQKSESRNSALPKSFKSKDPSIFEGQPEVSRKKLEYKVRMDPKIWRAGRSVGLSLSPVERSKLVKEVFSPSLGRQISKKDLQTSIRQLNRKMLNTKESTAHEKIRKEIKFFKKIGGV